MYIQGREHIPAKGPLIIAANHPNTFMDPLLIAAFVRQEIYFLANGSVFRNPVVAWILKQLHLIPVYRKKDVAEGQKADNRATFEKCFDFLAKKGTLLIFPEGSSEHERRLRPLKTGTARIALGAEEKHAFQVEVKILPVGLTYSSPKHFQSDVFLHFGKPIDVQTFQEKYIADAVEAVDELTEEIRKRIEYQTIVTSDAEQDLFVHNIERLYKTHLRNELNEAVRQGNTELGNADFIITKSIVKAVRYFEDTQPARLHQAKLKVQKYVHELDKLGLDDETISRTNRLINRVIRGAKLIVGFPLYVYGLAFNYLPYTLPSRIAPLISKDVTYRAPLMMSIGLFTFSLFYSVYLYQFQQWLHNSWLTAVFGLSLAVSGVFAWYYWLLLEEAYESWAFRRLSENYKHLIDRLLQDRKEIHQLLEEARKEYLQLFGA